MRVAGPAAGPAATEPVALRSVCQPGQNRRLGQRLGIDHQIVSPSEQRTAQTQKLAQTGAWFQIQAIAHRRMVAENDLVAPFTDHVDGCLRVQPLQLTDQRRC